MIKRRHAITPAEERAQKRYWDRSRGDNSITYPHIPRYDFTPTGILTIQVGRWPSRSWKDTPRTQLEQRLGEVRRKDPEMHVRETFRDGKWILVLSVANGAQPARHIRKQLITEHPQRSAERTGTMRLIEPPSLHPPKRTSLPAPCGHFFDGESSVASGYDVWLIESAALAFHTDAISKPSIMLERLLNGLLWLSNLFAKSSDPLLQEFRQRQRLVMLSALFSVGCLLAALIVGPSAYRPDETYQLAVTPVLSMFSTFLAGAGALALLVFMWASYRLWSFMEQYEE